MHEFIGKRKIQNGFISIKKEIEDDNLKKSGEYKGGIWCPNNNLLRNNPGGFNQHKKNPSPKVNIELTKEEKDLLILELYRASRKFHNAYKSCIQRISFMEKSEAKKYTDDELLESAKEL